ncbi:STAS domain-containing protein [Nonomuraea sp. NN258]|uniref:STAS domain-containing protein n=1 Tax=Nonomuraea antri TaxID=2730852 RepID=UPI001568228B|nr:STAS domain-containing protein [Nonomuraea antri]NRQ37434.1 STAS domain-containing protein [Nonomuraea antri]
MSDGERLLYQDEQLRITARLAPGIPAVMLIGEVDATNSPALSRTLTGSRQDATYIVVDTGGLTFIDLSGLRVLVMPALPPAQRWIRLHNVTPSQQRLLRLLGWLHEPRPQGVWL